MQKILKFRKFILPDISDCWIIFAALFDANDALRAVRNEKKYINC